jgi:hypothetical protein
MNGEHHHCISDLIQYDTFQADRGYMSQEQQTLHPPRKMHYRFLADSCYCS